MSEPNALTEPTPEVVSDEFVSSIHEAGHAVACVCLRIPFKYVTIIPNEERKSGGHLQTKTVHYRWRVLRGGRFLINPRFEAHLIMTFAGISAQEMYVEYDEDPDWAAVGDLRAAENLVEDARIVSAERKPVYLAKIREKARQLVRQPQNMHAIELVATALRNVKTLNAQEVRGYWHDAGMMSEGIMALAVHQPESIPKESFMTLTPVEPASIRSR